MLVKTVFQGASAFFMRSLTSRSDSLLKDRYMGLTVADKSSPRNYWPLGRILKAYPGRDGLVRSVRVKTVNGELVRPTEKLCLLEGHDV